MDGEVHKHQVKLVQPIYFRIESSDQNIHMIEWFYCYCSLGKELISVLTMKQ